MSKNKNLLAVDFDDTISARPALWVEVLETFRKFNFDVIVVTYRQPNCDPEDLQFLVDKGFQVYYTGQKAKRPFLKELGIEPTVWVDDTPESVLFDYEAFKGVFKKNEKQDFKLV